MQKNDFEPRVRNWEDTSLVSAVCITVKFCNFSYFWLRPASNHLLAFSSGRGPCHVPKANIMFHFRDTLGCSGTPQHERAYIMAMESRVA